MKKTLLLTQCAIALILIFVMVGCVEAGSNGVSVIKMNGGAYDHSKYTVGTDTATVSKEIGFTVTGNGGKFAYTASGPVSATSGDGNVSVSVDAMKLAISGKTSGSGVATANATILATGTANAAGVNVFNIVESETSVDTGKSLGSAEASASANGEAKSFAAYNGTNLNAGATGTTSAYGKVTSPKAYADSEGEILGVARYSTVNGQAVTDPFSEVESWVEGSGTATASATASGVSEAVASFDSDNYYVRASGNTAASGSSKYTGYFDVEAEVEARADEQANGNIAWTDISADAYTAGKDKYATATGMATVKYGTAVASAADTEEDGKVALDAISQGNASASSSIHGIGWADGEGEIYSESAENGHFGWGDNGELIGYQLKVSGKAVDYSYLDGNAEIGSGSSGFTGSAAGSATGNGAAGSVISQFDQVAVISGTSHSDASGNVASSATVKNVGMTDADAEIVSVSAIDADVWLGIWAHMDNIGPVLPNGLEDAGLQQMEVAVDFHAPVFEASSIQQIVIANAKTSVDQAEARAVASGETTGSGTYFERVLGDGIFIWGADTQATGSAKGIAQANKCTDPISSSIIANFDTSINGNGSLDASIVGSASFAHGDCGYTAAEATGTAGFLPVIAPLDVKTTSYAQGTAETMARAADADSFALAGVVSAAYAGEEEMSLFDAMGSVVDASLVGSGALSFGESGEAAAEASGNTSAISAYSDETEIFSGSMYTQVIDGSAGSEVRVKDGVAFDAAGLGSVGLVQFAQDLVGQDDYTTGASLILDAAYADAPTKYDVAEAEGFAEGYTTANGGFIVNNLFTEPGYQKGDVSTFAIGEVADEVEAAWADPIAISAIGSVTSVNSESAGLGGTDLVVDGSFLGSIAMAEGQSAKASGDAAGTTGAQGQLLYQYLGEETGDYVEMLLNATTGTSGVAEASAYAGGGMALSIAGDASVNVVYGGPEPDSPLPPFGGGSISTEDQFGLDDLVGMVPQSERLMTTMETEFSAADESLQQNIELLSLLEMMDPRSGDDPGVIDASLIGSASFAVGKAGASSLATGTTASDGMFQVNETDAAGATDTVVLLTSDTIAEGISDNDVGSNNGIALSAGGIGSLDVVVWDYGTEEVPPTGDLIEASLLGDIVFANGFTSKDTAWAKATVEGETEANGAFVDELNSGSATVEAAGRTTGYAKATYMDPLSISLIGAVSTVEANATTIDPPPSALGTEFEVNDATFVLTMSTAAGKGTGIATGTAVGEAEVEHAENLNWFAETARIQDTEAETEGSFTSGVEVTNGIAVAAAGAMTMGEVEFERFGPPQPERVAESEASMFAYTGGKGAVVKANSGFTDVMATVYNADTRVSNDNLLLDSDAYVAGDASSSLYALNSAGESLARAESDAEANHVDGLPSNAFVESAYGVQMLGTNGGSLTVKAEMSDVDVYSNAYSRNPDETYAMVDLWDGGASAILQPKVNTATANAWNDFETYTFSLGGGVQIGGFADVNTLVDPNFAYAFRYGRAQGQGGVPPEAVPADFIVLW